MFIGVAFARSPSVVARTFIVLLLASGLCPPPAVASGITISGTPPASAIVGQQYTFQPSVSRTRRTPTFSIANKPAWATFSSSTGILSGVPAQAGRYPDILIRVMTKYAYASLPAFAITVTSPQAPVGGGGTTALSSASYSLQQNAGATINVTSSKSAGTRVEIFFARAAAAPCAAGIWYRFFR